MAKPDKYSIDNWIETIIYNFFTDLSVRRVLPTPAEAAQIAPFLQMYQTKKLEEIAGHLSSLWLVFADEGAQISIDDQHGIDVNVKEMPDKPGGKK